ncbi:hypothetical protein [Vibrio harveyi]|uniref:hypothetical protein n=1 Tax=Vibrio harveyi TaxID=669 RepID=UPI003CF36B5C
MGLTDNLKSLGSSVKSAYNRTEDAVKDTAQAVENTVSETTGSIKESVNSTMCSIETNYEKVSNTIMDGVDTVNGTVQTVKNGVKFVSDTIISAVSITAYLAQFGILIASVVAPVPTAIGLALMWVLISSIEYATEKLQKSATKAAEEKVQKSSKRSVQSALKLLQKYGKVPETATFGNDFISMTVNSSTGIAEGKILRGQYANMSLSELSIDTLSYLSTESKDADTKNILDTYVKYREKSELLNGL